jgi:hypothetical protein
MPLSNEQIFKVGFLMKCAEQGLTIEETHTRIKVALAHIKQAFLGPIGAAASALTPLAAAGAIGLPILAGGTTGYLAAKATGADGKSMVDEAKKDEIAAEYKRLAEEAKRRTKIKQIQNATGQRIIALTPSETTGG